MPIYGNNNYCLNIVPYLTNTINIHIIQLSLIISMHHVTFSQTGVVHVIKIMSYHC